MKSKIIALLLASAALGAGPAIFAPPASAHAEVELSFNFFHDSLEPYGDWIQVADYGPCWHPRDVDENWAPYTDGYWSYTDAGWTWVSYEDFGGITYHYGRWVSVEDEGWCWVPKYEWGPAWVSWRNNDDYVGWAPLPPEATWEPDRGFSVQVDSSYDIGPSNYSFCAVRDFGAPVIREVIIERPRNVVIIGSTFNCTNITINRSIGVPFCGGPRFDFFVGRVARPIPALKLVRETNVTNIFNNTTINNTVINKTVVRGDGQRSNLQAAVRGNQLIMPAPRMKAVDNPLAALPNFKPTKVIPHGKVNKGWQLVKDPGQREQLKQKIAGETKGLKPEDARAKPMDAAELKPVPVKGDPNAPSPIQTAKRPGKPFKAGKENTSGAPAETAASVGAGAVKGQQPGESPQKPELGIGAGKQNGKGKGNDTANVDATQPAVEPGEPGKPDRLGKGKDAAGGPLKPFKGADMPGEKGRKGAGAEAIQRSAAESATGQAAIPGESSATVNEPRQREKKGNKADNDDRENAQREQVKRAAEVQEQFRKQQQEERALRQQRQKQAESEAAEAAMRDQREKQQQKALRQQQQALQDPRDAQGADIQRQHKGEARRDEAQQGAAVERRQQMQAEAAAQQQQQQRQLQKQQQAAMEARREQMQAGREQAERRQQAEAQRQFQAERAQRQAQQPQPQPQAVPQGGGKGEGKGGGKGKRHLTPEEAAALQGR